MDFRFVVRFALIVVVSVLVGACGAPETEFCCAVVDVDSNTRLLTVRDTATGHTYECKLNEGKEVAMLRPGDALAINVTRLRRLSSGQMESSAQAATGCGGWNGPRGADTKTTKTPPRPVPPRPR